MAKAISKEINVQPQILNLALYAGDGLSFRLVCTDLAGAPVDITGTVNAQIRIRPIADDPAVVEFTAGLTDAYLGIVTLSLTGEQTHALSIDPSSRQGKFTGVWDIQWIPADSEPRTLCQGKVECVSDVTR
jgi:hypothetical protein